MFTSHVVFLKGTELFYGGFARLCSAEQLLVPIFDYDDGANGRAHLSFPNELAELENGALRFVLNHSSGSHHWEMLSSHNWRPLSQGRELNWFKMVHCQFRGVLGRALKPPPTGHRVRAECQSRVNPWPGKRYSQHLVVSNTSINH